MNLGELLLDYFWILLVAAGAYFLYTSNRRQRTAVVLALLFPGAGHLWIGRRQRGLLLGGIMVALFVAGMAMADFRNISPFERHPIWGIAQIPGGLMTVVAWLATSSLKVVRENPLADVGALYSGVACLLNLVAACDVWDLTESPEQRRAREARAR